MSLADDFGDFDPVKETQKAHDNALSNHWNGETLGPWTIATESAAMMLGCKILSDLSAFRRFFKTGTYPSVLQDVLIVLWLLVEEKAMEVAILGEDRAKELLPEVFKWAEENGVTRGSKGFKSGVELIAKIMAEKIRSQFEPEERNSGHQDKKKGLTQHGNSGSRHAQPAQAVEMKAT